VLRRAAEGLGVLAVSVALLFTLEGVVRVAERLREGYWPKSPATDRFEAAERLRRIVMPHPYLIGVPRPGGAATLYGKSATINSHGYRGAEFARPKPPGVFRVLAIGGSTTFDVCVTDDGAAWTSRLEEALRRRFPGRAIEVVNGGMPGYTSVEMAMKLELIDIPVVEPDIVLALVGVNDLQPSAAPGFRADYSVGHAEIQRRYLGLESRPPNLVERSVLLFKIRRRLGLEREDAPETPRSDATLPEAEAAYRARLEALACLAGERGIGLVFLTQALRFGPQSPMTPADSVSAFRWLPFLTASGMIRGMEHYNAITREVAAATGAALIDVARDLPATPEDFADYCHWTDAGAEKMAAFLGERLAETLVVGASAGAGPVSDQVAAGRAAVAASRR
jgi:lysophospholipase L1-like esterase